MIGLDDMEIAIPVATLSEGARQEGVFTSALPQHAPAADVLQRGGVILSSTGNGPPFDSYHSLFFNLAHVISFPNGPAGGRPAGMTRIADYARCLLLRCNNHQFDENVSFILDAFNTSQRQGVSSSTYATWCASKADVAAIGKLTHVEVEGVVAALAKRAGNAMSTALKGLSPTCLKLVRCVQWAGASVLGCPQSFRSMRSKMVSNWYTSGARRSLCAALPRGPSLCPVRNHPPHPTHAPDYEAPPVSPAPPTQASGR